MRTASSMASNWRMRSYKSSEAAVAAVAEVRQPRQPSSTHLSIFPFLKLATLSFAIPPPISVSVRSRQAGTETEREASAMEALGPGKRSNRCKGSEQRRESEPCLGSVCADAPLHWGPRLQRGLDALTGKQAEAQPERLRVCVCVCERDFIYIEQSTDVLSVPRELAFYRLSSGVCAVLFI